MSTFVTRAIRRLALAATVIAGSVGAAQAVPTTLPAGLNPGDSYRLAFVSSTSQFGQFSDISIYNTFVDNLAKSVTELNALVGIDWTAIVSTRTVDARDNTDTNPGTSTGAPIYLLDGTTVIADNNADLWDGTIDNLFNIDENGNTVVNAQVWTGSSTDGTGRDGQELGTPTPITGGTNSVIAAWITSTSPASTNSFRLYAISDTITIPGGPPPTELPAPGPLGLLAAGFIGLGLARRRIRR